MTVIVIGAFGLSHTWSGHVIWSAGHIITFHQSTSVECTGLPSEHYRPFLKETLSGMWRLYPNKLKMNNLCSKNFQWCPHLHTWQLTTNILSRKTFSVIVIFFLSSFFLLQSFCLCLTEVTKNMFYNLAWQKYK